VDFDMYGTLTPSWPRVDTLRALRESGVKIALVSDCTHELPDLWNSLELEPYFDATVFSCSEGVRKPAAELFLAAASRLGVEPRQCLYVGDGGGDEMAGSAAVGMLPLVLVAPDWAQHHAPGRPEQEWTGLRATALSQIPDMLSGLAPA
jgi:putative hydrolase of the HAD superfamily